MTDEQIENVAFAIWQTDYPMLKLPDWIAYSERVKRMYCKRAKAAIKAYKACSLAIFLTAILYFVLVSILMWRVFG